MDHHELPFRIKDFTSAAFIYTVIFTLNAAALMFYSEIAKKSQVRNAICGIVIAVLNGSGVLIALLGDVRNTFMGFVIPAISACFLILKHKDVPTKKELFHSIKIGFVLVAGVINILIIPYSVFLQTDSGKNYLAFLDDPNGDLKRNTIGMEAFIEKTEKGSIEEACKSVLALPRSYDTIKLRAGCAREHKEDDACYKISSGFYCIERSGGCDRFEINLWGHQFKLEAPIPKTDRSLTKLLVYLDEELAITLNPAKPTYVSPDHCVNGDLERLAGYLLVESDITTLKQRNANGDDATIVDLIQIDGANRMSNLKYRDDAIRLAASPRPHVRIAPIIKEINTDKNGDYRLKSASGREAIISSDGYTVTCSTKHHVYEISYDPDSHVLSFQDNPDDEDAIVSEIPYVDNNDEFIHEKNHGIGIKYHESILRITLWLLFMAE